MQTALLNGFVEVYHDDWWRISDAEDNDPVTFTREECKRFIINELKNKYGDLLFSESEEKTCSIC